MNYPILYQWTEEIAKGCPSLNSWQVANAGLFSQGVIKAQSSRQQEIARQVTCGEQVDSAARRLRRFVANKALKMEAFYGDLSHWIINSMPTSKVYLLVDETKLGKRIGALVVGVAWEGRCIPLAWHCYKADSQADYPEEGQVKLIERLLSCIKRGLGEEREVVLLADRGIGTSYDLCQAVEKLGWKYLFRVTRSICLYKASDGDYPIASRASEGQTWHGRGEVFTSRGGLSVYAHAIWAPGYAEPWILITNDASLSGHEYAQRNWQEQSFRDLKSHGWQWESSRTMQPFQMTRLMLLLVLAYAWTLVLGSTAVQAQRAHPLQRHSDGQLRRHWSLFHEGIYWFFNVVLLFGEYPGFQFIPDTRLL